MCDELLWEALPGAQALGRATESLTGYQSWGRGKTRGKDESCEGLRNAQIYVFRTEST